METPHINLENKQYSSFLLSILKPEIATDMSTSVSTTLTLRGSTDIVTEFFNYSVNSILYQRGVYQPESFKREKKYNLSMMMSVDESLNAYLGNVLKQLDRQHFLYI
jgi:hypothetical protein